MKKIISVILMTVLLLTMCVPVLAADDSRSTYISFTYIPAEPLYTVSIPGELALSLYEPNYLLFEITGNKNLSGQSIIITFEGTENYDEKEDLYELGLYYDTHRIYYSLFDFNDKQVMGYYGTPYYLYPGTILGILKAFNPETVAEYIRLEIDAESIEYLPEIATYTGIITFGISLQ